MRQQYKIISEKGPRDTMEDAFFVRETKDDFFCGIYDGHRGFTAAEHLRENLQIEFFNQLATCITPAQAFVNAYRSVSAKVPVQYCGSTAITLYIHDDVVHFAHAGDARLIIITDTGIRQLTNDHRLSNPREKARVKSSGALILGDYVMKGKFGLMPTRSIGDEYFRSEGIIPIPETGKHHISETDRWLIAGTDGLFDFIPNFAVGCKICPDALIRADRIISPKGRGKSLEKKYLLSVNPDIENERNITRQ